MTIKNVTAGLLVMSMVATSLPVMASEGEPTAATHTVTTGNPAPATGGVFRASLARAVESATVGEMNRTPGQSHAMLAPEFSSGSGAGSGAGAGHGPGGGGGMGVASMVLMTVGTVVGIGATVYMIKQMKKTTSTPTVPGQ
jgi:hypothetical protein